MRDFLLMRHARCWHPIMYRLLFRIYRYNFPLYAVSRYMRSNRSTMPEEYHWVPRDSPLFMSSKLLGK